jgi:hypothetical protein
VQLVVSVCVRVLHRHSGAELDVFEHCHPEGGVGGHACCVEGLLVELDEALPLFFGDP